MIIFLTLCYVGILAVAIKLGFIKLTLFWKLSPLLWLLMLFIVLFLPMQWGAPGGDVNVYQYVVEVIPNVTGEVIEVPVEPLQPLKRGDVLFRIDPVPFQAKVDQLKAQLEDTIQNVAQLEVIAESAGADVKKTQDEIEIRKSDIEASNANTTVAETSVQQAETGVEKATKLVASLKIQVAVAKRELDRQTDLTSKGAGVQADFDRAESQYTGLLSQLESADSDLTTARQALEGAQAALLSQRATEKSLELTLKQLVNAELPRVKADERQAKLAANSKIGNEHTSVAVVRAQLVAAQFDLDNTVVRAPSEGHVMAVSLKPGQRVANLPLRSWMPFIDHEKTEIVVAVQQYALRYIEPGQKAEVTFKIYPGKVFIATVARVAYTNPSAQLQPSGQLAPQSSEFGQARPYGVVIELEDGSINMNKLAGGASGSAAIYTQSMQATHVIRKVMIRMDGWMNYLIP